MIIITLPLQVSEVIYTVSKGSKFFAREEERDRKLTAKISHIKAEKTHLSKLDLSCERRAADALLAQLEKRRDLSQSIVHVDCDAFYASVEQLDRPELANLPFAVGGGVLTTCNYVARRYGVRSGMASFVAKKLCPQLILLQLNFDKYNSKAREIREILAEYDPRFESASIDEAYLNITDYCARHGVHRADAVAKMRRDIHEKTRITISAGIAANARLAKICSNRNKPNGQFELANERDAITAFMCNLPCREVNGIGRVLERELAAIGIKTCGDDVYQNRHFISRLFGEKAHDFLLEVHLGLGRTNVQPADEYERKSVGTESTFRDTDDPSALREKLRWTAEELEKDLRKAECKGRTLCLKVKMHTFEVVTRQVAVTSGAVHTAGDLYRHALPMLVRLEQEFPGLRIRLMGLRCTHLVTTKKPDTMAFFGLQKGRRSEHHQSHRDNASSDGRKRKTPPSSEDDDSAWEVWPEQEFVLIQDQKHQHDQTSAAPDTTTHTASPPPDPKNPAYRRPHGKEIVPNPKPLSSSASAPPPPEEEWFPCPVCNRPQSMDEKQLNDHIDLCLSKQAIRDSLHETASTAAQTGGGSDTGGGISGGTGNERKRGRPPGGGSNSSSSIKSSKSQDPRQRKIWFGSV